MIESLKIDLNVTNKKSTRQPYEWAKDVPYIQSHPVIDFKPGLNILFGPNGSGKSTIVGLCAYLLAADQGGISTVTENWVRQVIFNRRIGLTQEKTPLNAEVIHDGQAVCYVDPRKAIGLTGGTFDDDFFEQGVSNLFGSRKSSGQVAQYRFQTCALYLLNIPKEPDAKKKGTKKSRNAEFHEMPVEIDWRYKKDKNGDWGVNDVWSKALDEAVEILSPKCPVGPRTFLLDEPESGYSLVWQGRFWKNIMQHPAIKDKQVIVATHSPFALNIPDAHYIDMEEGYREQCIEMLSAQWGGA